MSAGQPFGSQFLPHAGPRGPAGMSPAGMAGVMASSGVSPVSMSPARAPGAGPLYGGQRVPQHTYPGPPSQQLPRQGLKRAYSNEVSIYTGGGHGMPELSSPPTPLPALTSPRPRRDTQRSSTSRAGSMLRPVPSMPPVPPSPPLRPPPTPATGCSRAWASTSPPRATLDPITRYWRGAQWARGGGGGRVPAVLWCHPPGTFLLPQPADQFNGQSASFSTYSQAAVNGVSPSTGWGAAGDVSTAGC